MFHYINKKDKKNMAIHTDILNERLPGNGVYVIPKEKYQCPFSKRLLATEKASNRIIQPLVLFDETMIPQVYEKVDLLKKIVQQKFDEASVLNQTHCNTLRDRLKPNDSESDVSEFDLRAVGFYNLIPLEERCDIITLLDLNELEEKEDVPEELVVTTCCSNSSRQTILYIYSYNSFMTGFSVPKVCMHCHNILLSSNQLEKYPAEKQRLIEKLQLERLSKDENIEFIKKVSGIGLVIIGSVPDNVNDTVLLGCSILVGLTSTMIARKSAIDACEVLGNKAEREIIRPFDKIASNILKTGRSVLQCKITAAIAGSIIGGIVAGTILPKGMLSLMAGGSIVVIIGMSMQNIVNKVPTKQLISILVVLGVIMGPKSALSLAGLVLVTPLCIKKELVEKLLS
jgi:hypothetical protein